MHRWSERTDWFQVEEVGPGIHRVTEPHYRRDYRCNMYLIRGERMDVLVDTGLGLAPLREFLRPLSADPLLVSSHAHYDHIGSNFEFPRRFNHKSEADVVAAPTHANTFADLLLTAEDFYTLPWNGWTARDWQIEPAPATGLLTEGDVLDLGNRQLRVLHTPGHSQGSLCLWDEVGGVLFCADTVYAGELFDTLPCSDISTYAKTMRRLSKFPVQTAYPGHGPILSGEQFRRIAADYAASHGHAE